MWPRNCHGTLQRLANLFGHYFEKYDDFLIRHFPQIRQFFLDLIDLAAFIILSNLCEDLMTNLDEIICPL